MNHFGVFVNNKHIIDSYELMKIKNNIHLMRLDRLSSSIQLYNRMIHTKSIEEDDEGRMS